MIKRKYADRDGRCFADWTGECSTMVERDRNCGSYKCPFYKPLDCEEWIKIEKEDHVEFYTPEEYYSANK